MSKFLLSLLLLSLSLALLAPITAAWWQQQRRAATCQGRGSWALGRFEMVACTLTKSSSPLGRTFCNFTNETLFPRNKNNATLPWRGACGGEGPCSVLGVYYVYRKISASLASSVALQLPLIIACDLARLMTLWSKSSLDRSQP